jgi:hypothetical protein
MLQRSFIIVGACLTLAVPSLEAPAAEAESLPACVTARAEVRYRPFGYDHLVYIHNGCDGTADCTVRTDVNPETMQVSVSSGAEVEVVTWVGSPARVFTATVACRLR